MSTQSTHHDNRPQAPRPAASRRAVRTHDHLAPAAPERVFPLLCPIREYEWIPGWSCDLLFSRSGVAERDCVFSTNFPQEGPETWLATRHEPPRLVEFVRMGPERVMRYVLALAPENGSTRLTITQTVTYLDREVAERRCALEDEEFGRRMERLMRLLDHWLVHGEALADAPAGAGGEGAETQHGKEG